MHLTIEDFWLAHLGHVTCDVVDGVQIWHEVSGVQIWQQNL